MSCADVRKRCHEDVQHGVDVVRAEERLPVDDEEFCRNAVEVGFAMIEFGGAERVAVSG